MRYRFQPFELDDNTVDLQPVLEVRIGHPLHSGMVSTRIEVLVDSGSTDCMFNAGVLRRLGLKLENGAQSGVIGISGKVEAQSFYHNVNLVVENQILRIKAAFVPGLCIGGVLGRRGFFENFKVTFDLASRKSFEIERHVAGLVRP